MGEKLLVTWQMAVTGGRKAFKSLELHMRNWQHCTLSLFWKVASNKEKVDWQIVILDCILLCGGSGLCLETEMGWLQAYLHSQGVLPSEVHGKNNLEKERRHLFVFLQFLDWSSQTILEPTGTRIYVTPWQWQLEPISSGLLPFLEGLHVSACDIKKKKKMSKQRKGGTSVSESLKKDNH